MRIALVTGVADAELVAVVEATDRPLVDALTALGAAVDQPTWHDPEVDWAAFDLAVVRTTWDYTVRRDEFVAWAARAAAATELHNPADVLRWNTHKSYLLELEERGAPVVPTAWLAQGDRIALDDLLAARGWTRAVAKPSIASGSDGLVRVAREGSAREGDAPVAAAQRHLDVLLSEGDVMVQPYLASIETHGELSVIVVDGEVSHAVRKTPVPGDYRIQEQFGGRYVEEQLDVATADLARWIVDACGVPLLFARVDLVEADDGTLQLAELEATEPDLYFNVVPQAAARLAERIVARLEG